MVEPYSYSSETFSQTLLSMASSILQSMYKVPDEPIGFLVVCRSHSLIVKDIQLQALIECTTNH